MTATHKNRGQQLGPWTDYENDQCALSYLAMLAEELRGEPFVKAQRRRAGLAAMSEQRSDGKLRTPGSWEMKCCNISATMAAAGLPWINGYKPLGNSQKSLIRALIWAMDALGYPATDAERLRALT